MSLTARPTTADRAAPGLAASFDRVTFESETQPPPGPPSPRTAFAVPYDPAETDARLSKEYEEVGDPGFSNWGGGVVVDETVLGSGHHLLCKALLTLVPAMLLR